MTLLTAAKAGGGAVAAAGIPASIYFAHDYMTSLYEVENKVIEENVSFSVVENTGGENNSKTIKVNTANSSTGTTWNETEGYYWECTISGFTGITINTSDITNKISGSESGSDSIKSNKQHLVSLCAKSREESTNKKVKAKFAFSDGTTTDNWKERLFGAEKPAPAA